MNNTIHFVGHFISSGTKRIMNLPASKFDELDTLLKELGIDEMKELYFKVHLEPIILKEPNLNEKSK